MLTSCYRKYPWNRKSIFAGVGKPWDEYCHYCPWRWRLPTDMQFPRSVFHPCCGCFFCNSINFNYIYVLLALSGFAWSTGNAFCRELASYRMNTVFVRNVLQFTEFLSRLDKFHYCVFPVSSQRIIITSENLTHFLNDHWEHMCSVPLMPSICEIAVNIKININK